MKRALGKGIDVLFGDLGLEQPAAEELVVREIPLMEIDPNLEQPRKRFDQEGLEQLAQSIKEVGVIQPIAVYDNKGRYTIIAGERRWRAARVAGLTTIPALVKKLDRVQRMEIALIENIQREDLNPIETAAAISRLMEECGLTQEAVALKLGRSRSSVANLLRLLTLPEPLQYRIIDKHLVLVDEDADVIVDYALNIIR
jgi:ParB family chromosome partitioning protein